nr:MAG TPA: integrase [Caudoviricetes sp.]DAZ82718.1 MAG TPA: integrase [Caudoviricetes sp.]
MSVDIKWAIPQTGSQVTTEGDLAAVYTRYSSHNQGEQSIEGQLAAARRYAAEHGYTIVREYTDRAKSGRTDDREAFQQMLRDTAKKQFSVIILWKVDRFGRNREEIAINKMKCRKNGVRVEYVAEQIPDSPEGVILESVLEGFAEYYSLQLSQNIRRGLAKSAEKCKVTGGNRPLGYKTGPDKEFLIDEDNAPTVKLIFDMYAKGSTVKEIVDHLNQKGLRTLTGKAFTKNSLHTVLKNEKYRGVYTYKDIRVEGGVPRIVDDDTWYKVQEMLKINKRAPAKTWTRADYILTDKLFCGKCGGVMFGECGTSRTGVRHNYYTCSNRKKHHACDKKAVRQEDIEDLVIKATCNIFRDKELLDAIIENTWQYYLAQSDNQAELKGLTKQLNQTELAIKNLLRAIEAGILTEDTKARMDELTAQKAELKAAIADLQLARGFHLQKSHIAYYLTKLCDANYKDRDVQKRLIQTFVNAIFVFDDHLKITFNFSGDKNTVTLSTVQDAESGNVFGHRALCSTKIGKHRKMLADFILLFSVQRKFYVNSFSTLDKNPRSNSAVIVRNFCFFSTNYAFGACIQPLREVK